MTGDAQPIILGIISAIVGALVTLLLRLIDKRRTPEEVQRDRADIISTSAFANAEIAREVNTQLRETLLSERTYHREQMDSMRLEFNKEITQIRKDYDLVVSGLRKELEICRGKQLRLLRRLAKYEDVTGDLADTGKHKAVINNDLFKSGMHKAVKKDD